MKIFRRQHKNLFVFEAGYILFQRLDKEYSFDLFMDLFMSEEFDEIIDEKLFDEICKDIRYFRYHESYQLKEITVEEYEKCFDYFEKHDL